MSGRRSSAPGMAGQQQFASLYMYDALYRVARKLPPNPKVEPKDKTDRRHKYKVKDYRLTEDQITESLVRNMAGESVKDLAHEIGVSDAVFRQWRNGTSRPKCLIEAEKRYAKMLKDRMLSNG